MGNREGSGLAGYSSGQVGPAQQLFDVGQAKSGETIDGADAQTSIMNETIGSQVVKDFLERVQAVTWGKRLLRTKVKDWLGLGPNKPKSVQNGDAICILFGCSVPVILREHNMNDDSRYYELIGECYIHGMMNGDALKERNDPSRKISNEEFIIR